MKEVTKAFVVVLALLGAVVVLDGLGALGGSEELRSMARILADLFGES